MRGRAGVAGGERAKLFGLGHKTAEKAAWINGGSPTKGFLGRAVAGPFKDFSNDSCPEAAGLPALPPLAAPGKA